MADGDWVAEGRDIATVVSLALEECSAKVRTGPPLDDEEDYELDAWAGVVPIRTEMLAPVPDPRLRAGIETPGHVTALVS